MHVNRLCMLLVRLPMNSKLLSFWGVESYTWIFDCRVGAPNPMFKSQLCVHYLINHSICFCSMYFENYSCINIQSSLASWWTCVILLTFTMLCLVFFFFIILPPSHITNHQIIIIFEQTCLLCVVLSISHHTKMSVAVVIFLTKYLSNSK